MLEKINEHKDEIVKLISIFILLGLICGGCHYINQKFNLNNDNIAEEFLEEVIESKTGLDLDLTPNSKE